MKTNSRTRKMLVSKRQTPRRSSTADSASSDSTNSERGAALVEFSLVALLLLTICLGIFEMGTAWSTNQLVTQAARSGARSGSQVGINTDADEAIVKAVEAALGDSGPNLERIVVYKATDVNGAMPPQCVTAAKPGIANLCSVYDAADFATYGAFVNGAWDPTTRNNELATADQLAVRVEIREPFLTGFFGQGTYGMNDTAIMRIEPNAGNAP